MHRLSDPLASTLDFLWFHRFDPSQYSLAVHAWQINRKIEKIKTVRTTLPLDFAD
jgi:hypothetical protein